MPDSSPANPHPSENLHRIRAVFVVLGVGILAVFAAVLATTLLFLRNDMRQLVMDRDASLLTSLAQHLYQKSQPVEFPEFDLLGMAVESSELRGVIGVRVFSASGDLIARAPTSLYPVRLAPDDRQHLLKGQPVTRFFPQSSLASLFRDTDPENPAAPAPLLEVIAPLRNDQNQTTASVQYWLDGTTIAAEFKALDRSLLGMGLFILLGGGAILIVILVLARKRLQRMAALLASRNQSLRKANQQLARTARSAAIGSVTSHLFHGLKNPLAGLQSYLRLTSGDDEAVALTQRMQALIQETLAVIQEESRDDPDLALSLEEWVDMIRSRLQPEADQTTVNLHIRCRGDLTVPAHKARLALLVLRNLVENALQASPPNATITIDVEAQANQLSVTVSDKGPGLPPEIQKNLFHPVHSTKENGSGIGLAIAHLIAEQIPAELHLTRSGPEGTAFLLTFST